jgi:hypothetical protein
MTLYRPSCRPSYRPTVRVLAPSAICLHFPQVSADFRCLQCRMCLMCGYFRSVSCARGSADSRTETSVLLGLRLLLGLYTEAELLTLGQDV